MLTLTACTTTRTASSRKGEIYKVGEPYQVLGQWYAPKEDPSYEEIGLASWYGPGFHGKSTANGDAFDQHALTAAHRTLPLPSLVRVTNLDNGRSAVLKVNDRGPFSKNRILDVSKYAAEVLDFKNQGVQKVRVQFLPEESAQLLADLGLKRPNTPEAIQVAKATEVPDRLTETLPAEPAAGEHMALANNNPPEGITPVEKVEYLEAPVPVTRTAMEAPTEFSIIPQAYAEEAKPVMAKPKPVEEKHAAVPVPVTEKPAYAAAATSPAKGIFVQIGSFSVEQNADKAKQKLAGEGKVILDAVTVNNRTLYRVRMGPFASNDEAEAALRKAQGDGFNDARVVHN